MGFLRRLFGGEKKDDGNADPHGIYIHVLNERCDAYVRVRIDKRHDLNNENGGFAWYKTIVDAKCFQRLQAIIRFDSSYHIVSQEIDPPGKFITEAEYTAGLAAQEAAAAAAETAAEAAAAERESQDDPSSGGSSGFS